MTDQATVCIVDDDEAVRDSLDALLTAAGHGTRTYDCAKDFLNSGGVQRVGCVLLDVKLPDGDGIDVLNQLKKSGFAPPVIIITGHGDVPMAVKAMRIGALDFVEKPLDPDNLLEVVEHAIEVYRRQRQSDAQAHEARAQLSKLTPRETDIMRKLVIGQPNKVIASELGLSPRTVEIHRARVMEKTGAKSLSHLVRLAISAGVDAEL